MLFQVNSNLALSSLAVVSIFNGRLAFNSVLENHNNICPKVTKMGSIVGHRIDYNGVGILRGQRHILSKT